MPIEHHVVSLDIAKQLKEAGYDQQVLFHWEIVDGEKPTIVESTERSHRVNGKTAFYYAAPLASELGEQLPTGVGSRKNLNGYSCYFNPEYMPKEKQRYKDNPPPTRDENETNARAKMWLYLKKNNLLQEGK